MSIDYKIVSVLDQLNTLVKNNVGYNNRGNWTPNTEYEVDDVVSIRYSLWVCTIAHTSGSTMVDSNWEHIGVYTEGASLDPTLDGVIWMKNSGA